MNKKIFFLIFSIFLFNSYGAVSYNNGDTLYVWAFWKLNIRSSPSINSKIVSSVPYGNIVVVSDTMKNKEPSKLSFGAKRTRYVQTSPYTLTGFWIRVSVNNVEGYAFDAFLSKMPCVIFGSTGYPEQLDIYLNRVFGMPDDSIVTENKNELSITIEYKYSENISYSKWKNADRCFKDIYTFNNISFNEGLLLIQAILTIKDDDPYLLETTDFSYDRAGLIKIEGNKWIFFNEFKAYIELIRKNKFKLVFNGCV